MTIVVKLGGTNGSGKTSVARALLDDMLEKVDFGKHTRGVLGGYKKPGLYWSILGKYKTVCGGMDTISDKNERIDLIVQETTAQNVDVVFFEGLITGKTYGQIGEMSEAAVENGDTWIYAFMDTPFEVCVERVMQRRAKAEIEYKFRRTNSRPSRAPFDPERTMLPTYKAVQATAKRAAAQGHKVVWLPHKLKPSTIAQYLVNVVEEFSVNT